MNGLRTSTHPYRLRFHGRFATATGSLEAREGILVRVELDGMVGWGEAAPFPGHGRETVAEAAAALEALLAALHDWTSSGEADVPSTFAELRALADRLAAVAPNAPAARAGLDLALADLASRRAGLPLAHWLDAAARPAVPVNGTIGAVLRGRAEQRARRLVAEGYRTLKLKVGRDDLADLERVAAVREAVGRGIDLRVDANGAWDELRAEVMIESLAPHRLEYVEQPVPADRIEDLAALRRASRVPLAADESLLEPDGLERVLWSDAADVLVLKPSLIGGPSVTWAAAEAARARGVAVVVTSALEGAIGRAGALHVAAALPGLERACGLATGDFLADDLARLPEPVGGRLALPEGPGIGVGPED